jgi:hypothetical protein
MSSTDSKLPAARKKAQTEVIEEAAEKRREDTFTRLRSALLEERLAVMETSSENSGTDPYNSGVHRAMAKAHVWSKRSR